MYSGIVLDISWERVFVTISGEMREITSEDEKRGLLLTRYKGLYAERENRRASTSPSFSDDYIEGCFRSHADELKAVIGESYDPDRVYMFLRNEDYLNAFLVAEFPGSGQDDVTDADAAEGGVRSAAEAGTGAKPFSITLNVTTFQGRRQIPDGIYYLSIFHGGIDFEAGISVELAKRSFEISRPFVFDKRRQCYLVDFFATVDEQDPCLKIQVMLAKTTIKKKFDMSRFIRETRDTIIKKLITLYYNVIYSISPHNGKNILFSTESRGTLSGNLKAVYDRMIERGLDKEYNISISERKAAGGHSSRASWLRTVTLFAKADVILIDDYAPMLSWLKLNRGTILIQLWHAGVGFKSVGLCRFGTNGSPLLDNAHRQYDYAIVGSTALKKIYAEVFGIEEDAIIPTGLPRIDKVIDKEENQKKVDAFHAEHPELKGRKLILFAPTFRGVGALTATYPYEKLDMKRIYDMCGDEYAFIFKMHPFIKEKPEIPEEYSDRIIDMSGMGDINDLLPCVDILITDYSSVIYEFSLFRRPMLFFAYDRDSYAAIRGFQSDYDDFAPGRICTTFDELEKAIKTQDFQIEKVDRFVAENFDYMDSGASDRFIDWLLTHMK